MCGFLAEYNYNEHTLTARDSFENLLELSKHRGPDSTEIVRNENFQLGFNRLAILDLSPQGNQPKKSPSGRYHIVFNGEIYNYQELKEQYQLHNLESTSDTEVLVHLCDEIGIENAIKSLNGMFAITIVDTQTNSVYLTRDFAGIKPLFYGVHNNGIVSASQFDQVFKHEWFKSNLKLKSSVVKEYFGFGYMQAPNTIYEHIFQVNPGELLHFDTKGSLSMTKIEVFAKQQSTSHEINKTPLGEILKRAVQRQLVSDVSVASFLSGGIDSPLITAYAKAKKTDIEGFTLKVNDPRLNESDIAKAYAKHLNVNQHIVAVDPLNMLFSIDRHFKAYSEPFGDYSSIPTYMISEAAKKRHTVMLSGDGGDELFFGYPRMLDVLNKRLWFKVPFLIRRPIAKVTNTLGITNSWAPFLKSLNDFVFTKHIKVPMYILNRAFPKTGFSKSMNELYTFDNNSRKTLLHQLRWNEFYAHMQRILIKVDRASMANSLEVRVPFLDKESIYKAWTIFGDLHSKDDLKKALKTLLSNEVDEALINKKKMGFSVPLHEWLRNELKEDVLKHIFDLPFYGGDILDATALKEYVQDFYDKKHNNSWGVWHVYSWQKWAYSFVINAE